MTRRIMLFLHLCSGSVDGPTECCLKKTIGITTLLSLSFSMSAVAMGLGQLRVFSSLDEPFNAEIELIDVGHMPLSGIKASLASVDEFQHLGFERSYALGSLNFTIEKKSNGKPIVIIRSHARMKDPLLQLLVDLTWAEGQIDRAYTVLLDPPHYQISSKRVYSGDLAKGTDIHRIANNKLAVMNEEAHGSTVNANSVEQIGFYGPTLVNETVWQVAQRYKTNDVLLQQMILAIVGKNPSAFTEGNLNGLKQGMKLQIPSHLIAEQVPADVAEMEVQAHDKAWQNRQPIQHVLLPPYFNAVPSDATGNAISVIPPVPLISEIQSAVPYSLSYTNPLHPQEISAIEKDVVLAAVDTVRRANVILIDQMKSLKQDNQRLKQKLAKRERELRLIEIKLKRLLAKQLGRGTTPKDAQMRMQQENAVFWLIFLSMLGIVAAIIYKTMRNKKLRVESTEQTVPPLGAMEDSEPPHKPDAEELIPQVLQQQSLPLKVDEAIVHETQQAPQKDDEIPIVEDVINDLAVPKDLNVESTALDSINEEPLKKPTTESNLLEFDLTPALLEDKDQSLKESPEVLSETQESKDEMSIDFESDPIENTPSAEALTPTKSKAALETLLSLANTYISMGDEEAARQSLEEVIQYGSKKQQEAARVLLERLPRT